MQITFLEDGPILVKTIVDENKNKFDEIMLCRCGLSHDKPLCDGSHVDFQSKVDTAGFDCDCSSYPYDAYHPMWTKGWRTDKDDNSIAEEYQIADKKY